MTRSWTLSRIILASLLLAAIPFLILGAAFEDSVRSWFERPWPTATRFWLIVLLLGIDVVAPIPSSALGTYAGQSLGWAPAALAIWIGLSLGACLGYLLARWCGERIIQRWIHDADRDRLQSWGAESSAAMLLLLRPLPVLAEASVILAGFLRLPWRTFAPPVLVGNLLIALIYAFAGAWSRDQNWAPQMIVISLIVPVAATWIVRRLLSRRRSPSPQNPEEH